MVFLVGWMQGITAELVENSTGLISGQIEIHASEYRPERSLYETIGGRAGVDVGQVLRAVSSDASVVAAAHVSMQAVSSARETPRRPHAHGRRPRTGTEAQPLSQ